MMLYEWNAEEAIRMIQQEAIEDGLEEGRERGLKEGREKGLKEGLKEGSREGREEARAAFLGQVAQMVADGLLTIDVATERFGFTEEELTAALGA